jgi:NAD-dependent deacetylase
MVVPPRPHDGARVVILSGGGLSIASDIPAHRDSDGLWEGRSETDDIAAVEAWRDQRETVRRYYDVRRVNCALVLPNEAHEALARLQHRWGARRVVLATLSIDGLLTKAGAADVIEINGSLWFLQCEGDAGHPHIPVAGPQPRDRKCAICGAILRPDVVWKGEPMRHIERIRTAVQESTVFVCVGVSAMVEPVSTFLEVARAAGAHCVEINPVPSGAPFHDVVAAGAEEVIPAMVAAWLHEA